MEKRGISKLMLILLLVVIIAVVIALILAIRKPKIEPYSDNPKTWVNDKGGGIKEVSVDEVTKGDSYVDAGGNQQVITADIGTVFTSEGWYKGRYFSNNYEEDGKTLMKIGSDMNPNDGIIEGIIVEKFENGKPFAYIFLDNDWKNRVFNTTVFWGKLYEHEKTFVFNEISPGVYMDKIEDDMSRFENDFSIHKGGIYVGDLRSENDNEFSTIIASN